MHRIGMVCLAAVAALLARGAGTGIPDKPEDSPLLRFPKQALIDDFRQMRDVLEKNHAALYEYAPKATLDSIMDRQCGLVRDSMSLHEFFVLLTPVVARIGCGHTNVWMPMSYWDRKRDRMFPLRIRLLEDMAVVSGSYSGPDHVPRGSIILGINGRPVEEIIAEMKANYPADAMNPYFIHKAVERRFPMIYARRFGFPGAYRIVYTTPGATMPDTFILPPASNESVRAVVFKNFSAPELRMSLMPARNSAVMRIETFIYYDRVAYFKNFIDSCFKVIHDRKIRNLILDLRGNDGGDPFCAVPLFSYLEPKPLPYFAEPYGKYSQFAEPIPRAQNAFEGNLLILMDGRCFSTNAHFCSLLKYHKIGTIIGTPSGATYKCNAGKNLRTDLKNTGIMLYFGRSTFYAAVNGMDKTQPIMPDVSVVETYKDFLEGRDAFMETALTLTR